ASVWPMRVTIAAYTVSAQRQAGSFSALSDVALDASTKVPSAVLACWSSDLKSRPPFSTTPLCAGRNRVRSENSLTISSRAIQSMNAATSVGFLAYLTATRAAPPGMPVQAAGPQGLPVATQSKLLPILVARLATCQDPE